MSFRLTLRSLLRSPRFALAVTSTLALGLAASMLVFATARALILAPADYERPSSLIRIQERDGSGALTPLSAAGLLAARERSSRLGAPGAVDMGMFTLRGVAEPAQFAGAAVTPDLLETLGVSPMLGRGLSAARPDEVMLSHAAWVRRFGGDPEIVGRLIQLDWSRTRERESFRVAGVMPRGFWLFYRGLEVWTPLPESSIDPADPRRRYLTLARDPSGEARRLSLPLEQGDRSLVTSPLLDGLTAKARPAVAALAVGASLLLLLATANASALLLVRNLTRRHEFATRTALGASRRSLVRMVYCEALVVSFAGTVAAVPLVYGGMAALRRLLSVNAGMIQFTPGIEKLHVDVWTFVFAAAATLIVGATAAVGPVLALNTANARSARTTRRDAYLYPLLGVEAALTIVLLSGAGLLLQSAASLDGAGLGFQEDGVLIARIPQLGGGDRSSYYDEVERRVSGLPGVAAATLAGFHPLTRRRANRGYALADGSRGKASVCVTAPNFFDLYRTPVLLGRGFDSRDGEGTPRTAMINQKLASRHFVDRSPLGARLVLEDDEEPVEIVGVVADVRQSLDGPAPAMIYRPRAQAPGATLQLAVRASLDPALVAPAIRREVGLAGGVTAELSTMAEMTRGESWRTEASGAVMAAFSATAFALAMFGAYAVVAFVVSRRRREIAVRSALGARRSDVSRLFLLRGLQPVAFGVAIGTGGALALGSMLESLLYGVQADDPLTLAASVGAALAGVSTALWLPARRAARVEPALALKAE